jgi:hypothetical protein
MPAYLLARFGEQLGVAAIGALFIHLTTDGVVKHHPTAIF